MKNLIQIIKGNGQGLTIAFLIALIKGR